MENFLFAYIYLWTVLIVVGGIAWIECPVKSENEKHGRFLVILGPLYAALVAAKLILELWREHT